MIPWIKSKPKLCYFTISCTRELMYTTVGSKRRRLSFEMCTNLRLPFSPPIRDCRSTPPAGAQASPDVSLVLTFCRALGVVFHKTCESKQPAICPLWFAPTALKFGRSNKKLCNLPTLVCSNRSRIRQIGLTTAHRFAPTVSKFGIPIYYELCTIWLLWFAPTVPEFGRLYSRSIMLVYMYTTQHPMLVTPFGTHQFERHYANHWDGAA